MIYYEDGENMEYEMLLRKYEEAISYIKILEKENARLRSKSNEQESFSNTDEKESKSLDNGLIGDESTESNTVNDNSSNKEKVKMYLKLFRGREEVSAKRWTSKKTGKSGYAPYCFNDWVEGVCGKYNKIKCSKCKNQKLQLLRKYAMILRFHPI